MVRRAVPWYGGFASEFVFCEFRAERERVFGPRDASVLRDLAAVWIGRAVGLGAGVALSHALRGSYRLTCTLTILMYGHPTKPLLPSWPLNTVHTAAHK